MNEASSEEQERKERVEHKRMLYIYSSAILIEALKGNEIQTKELLHKCGDPARREVLKAISRLKNWIEDY